MPASTSFKTAYAKTGFEREAASKTVSSSTGAPVRGVLHAVGALELDMSVPDDREGETGDVAVLEKSRDEAVERGADLVPPGA